MPSNPNYRVGLIQMSCGPDPDANLDKAADRVREAARQGANVVCLPELFRAQYFCQREDTDSSILLSPSPARVPNASAQWPAEEKLCWWLRYLNAERRPLPQYGRD